MTAEQSSSTSESSTFPEAEHDLLISVKELKETFEKAALEKAESASQASNAAEKARQELIKRLKSNDPIPEKTIESVLRHLRHVALEGEEQLMVARFPNEVCTDSGRAINQAEEGWPDTLTGQPRQVYNIWNEHLRPLGYHLRAQIVDWPNGMPGDVGLFVTWKLS